MYRIGLALNCNDVKFAPDLVPDSDSNPIPIPVPSEEEAERVSLSTSSLSFVPGLFGNLCAVSSSCVKVRKRDEMVLSVGPHR